MSEDRGQRPATDEFAPYYGKYINLVPETDVVPALGDQLTSTLGLLRKVPESEADKTHPPYTWTFKEVLGHVIDTERIFAYRALRFARGDTTELPGFEEGDYVRHGGFGARTLADLVEEFDLVRRSSLALFGHLDREAWTRVGVANGARITVRALAFIILGHERHHVTILRRRLEGDVSSSIADNR